MIKQEWVLFKPYRLNPIVIRWVGSFASCAVEGNQLAITMIELWNNGREDEFVKRLEREWQPELSGKYND